MINSINPIGPFDGITPIVPAWEQRVEPKGAEGTSFEDFMSLAMNMYTETSQLELYADKLQEDFVLGKSEDMLGVMIAQEKAYTSLQFTVQVTSKIIESYRELMRLQI